MSERKTNLILIAVTALLSLMAVGALSAIGSASMNTLDGYGVNALQVQVIDTTRN